MALSPQLAAIKSSGVYRMTFDKSQTVGIPAEQIRLVVGFSRKGPFNTPIYVPDSGFFEEVFGTIDRALERKNSFFHRTCLAALERGPILALNLLNLDDSLDTVENMIFSTSASGVNSGFNSKAYTKYYNKEKFWFPDADVFLESIEAEATSTNKLFNLTNVNGKPVSVIVRHAENVNTGFNVKAKEWYGISDVPEFLDADDYISDFMIDVFVIEGEFGPDSNGKYGKYANDPLFTQYFNTDKGLIRKVSETDSTDTNLDAFLNLNEVNLLAKFTGSLIPDFIDNNGNPLFIQDVINQDVNTTGLLCAVNQDAFDTGEILSNTSLGIDMIGHSMVGKTPASIDFLSYKTDIASIVDIDFENVNGTIDDVGYFEHSNINPAVSTTGLPVGQVTIQSDHENFITAVTGITINTLTPTRTKGHYLVYSNDGGTTRHALPIIGLQTNPDDSMTITMDGYSTPSGTAPFGSSSEYSIVDSRYLQLDRNAIKASEGSALYEYVDTNLETINDQKLKYGDNEYYIQVSNLMENDIYADFYGSSSDIAPADISVDVHGSDKYSINNYVLNIYEDAAKSQLATLTSGDYVLDVWDKNEQIHIINDDNIFTKLVETSANNGNIITTIVDDEIKVGNYLINNEQDGFGNKRLTKIVKVVKVDNTLVVTTDATPELINKDSKNYVTVYKPVHKAVSSYQVFNLKGFKSNHLRHLPNGTQERQDEILNVIFDTNLFTALADKNEISFRYIVDTFGGGIQVSSKEVLGRLAKERENALAILNAPSIKDFAKSTNPSFKDYKGIVSTKMISEGGDLTKNPSVTYSLPGVDKGSNYVAYYGPFLQARDRGKTILVPPAGYVSNNFIDKYVNALPWSIVAGPRRGSISGRGIVGIEQNFTKEDRDNLEPFGINPIISQQGSGLVIYGNKTGQQNIKSALSSVHVREVLIYIQDGIAAILKNFLFELNTAQTRLEIKTLADNFMSKVLADGGVYDFKNIMDDTNNTSEIIDQNIGILDTYIEPVRGLEVLVHRTTILKTGQISTGEFL